VILLREFAHILDTVVAEGMGAQEFRWIDGISTLQ